jgi:phage gp36-like protein
MGDYATTTSFPQLLPYILQGNSVSDATGVAIIAAHITRAEGVVKAYVANRYSLPFAVVPPILRTLSEDLASYYTIRASYVQDGERKNEFLPSYKDAMSMLEQIRDGKMPLALTDGSMVSQNANSRYKSSTEQYSPIFNLDSEEAWDADPDQISDITSGR